MSEFSKNSKCGNVIGPCCRFFGFVESLKHSLTIAGDKSAPLLLFFVPMHSLESRLCSHVLSLIPLIFRSGRNAEISASVVESLRLVSVLSFAWITSRKSKNLPMHEYGFLFSRRNCSVAECVKTSGSTGISGVPIVLGYLGVIFGIDKSNLSLRQRDFTIGFKEWECHAGLASCVV